MILQYNYGNAEEYPAFFGVGNVWDWSAAAAVAVPSDPDRFRKGGITDDRFRAGPRQDERYQRRTSPIDRYRRP